MIWNTAQPWPSSSPDLKPSPGKKILPILPLGQYQIIAFAGHHKNSQLFKRIINCVFRILKPTQYLEEFSFFKDQVRNPLHNVYIIINRQDRPMAIVVTRENEIISYFCQHDSRLLELLKRARICHPDFNITALLHLIMQS